MWDIARLETEMIVEGNSQSVNSWENLIQEQLSLHSWLVLTWVGAWNLAAKGTTGLSRYPHPNHYPQQCILLAGGLAWLFQYSAHKIKLMKKQKLLLIEGKQKEVGYLINMDKILKEIYGPIDTFWTTSSFWNTFKSRDANSLGPFLTNFCLASYK